METTASSLVVAEVTCSPPDSGTSDGASRQARWTPAARLYFLVHSAPPSVDKETAAAFVKCYCDSDDGVSFAEE